MIPADGLKHTDQRTTSMFSTTKRGDIIARFPGPVTLYPSRLKWGLILTGFMLFTFVGCAMVINGDKGGWFVVYFCSAGTLIGIIPLLPGGGGLTLDQYGFETVNMFRRTRTRWRDASGFETMVQAAAPGSQVVYDDASRNQDFDPAANPLWVAGHNAALPDTYGLRAKDLAWVMESWRTRALAPHDQASAN
jgi:hypothetical protein